MHKGKILINVDDIIGKRLGKLEVISYAGNKHEWTNGGNRMRHFYICECKCGRTKKVRRGQLVNEIIHSCGCGRGKYNGYKDEEK